jgi:hypothetical protein
MDDNTKEVLMNAIGAIAVTGIIYIGYLFYRK